MVSAYKFIQKFWNLHKNIKIKLETNLSKENETKEFEKFANTLINKVSISLENFSYNVLIANLYETYNFLVKNTDLIFNNKVIIENYIKNFTVFSPVIPHIISECLEDLKINKIMWPEIE